MLAAGQDWLIPPWALALGVVAALAVAVVSRAGWIKIFGPVLFYEVIRAARRDRYFLLRTCYAGGLFLLLLWIHSLWTWEHYRRDVRNNDLVQLAEYFYKAYASVQYLAVILLTPAYVAGCVAEDKERRILEFLLATDLANREIIFGKLLARVGNLLMFLLTGLPILSLLQFFGGIDPVILLVTTGATAMTMLGLVGVSMFNSVQRRRGRDAIVLTYGVAMAYMAVSWLLYLYLLYARFEPNSIMNTILQPLHSAIEIFRWGDPIAASMHLDQILSSSADQGRQLFELLGRFAAFHGTVFVLGVAFAVWKLRTIALRQAGGGDVTRKAKRETAERSVSDRPMYWKEVVAEGGLRLGMPARIGFNVLIASGFIPIALIVYEAYWLSSRMSYENLTQGINVWVRIMNPILTTLMFLGIAVRAAGSIGSERDRDTLISLLTTPLSSADIINGKLWGAILSVRKLVYWLAAVWAIGLFTGSVFPFMIVAQLIALVPPAFAAASFGLFCSVSCTTTLRAVTLTALGMVFGLGGHWIIVGMCCIAPLAMGRVGDGGEFIVAFFVGLTPPAVFGVLPFHPKEDWWYESRVFVNVVMATVAHLSWCLMGVAFYNGAVEKFARITHRERIVRPINLPQPTR